MIGSMRAPGEPVAVNGNTLPGPQGSAQRGDVSAPACHWGWSLLPPRVCARHRRFGGHASRELAGGVKTDQPRDRCRTASNSAMPAATETLRLDTLPAIGIAAR